MLKILCVDDDIEFLDKLVKHFEDKDVRVYSYTSFPSVIPEVDACFLDIEVSEENSIDWSKQIKNLPIIFISNHEQYVFDVVKLQVFDFIRKSHFEEEIEKTISSLLKYLYNKTDFLSLKYKGVDYHIPLMDILYIETYSHQCCIHTIDCKTYEFKKDFQSFQIHVPYLIKTHHSYIMNTYHCLSLNNKKAYLKNDIIIPISFRRKKEVEEAFHSTYIKSS